MILIRAISFTRKSARSIRMSIHKNKQTNVCERDIRRQIWRQLCSIVMDILQKQVTVLESQALRTSETPQRWREGVGLSGSALKTLDGSMSQQYEWCRPHWRQNFGLSMHISDPEIFENKILTFYNHTVILYQIIENKIWFKHDLLIVEHLHMKDVDMSFLMYDQKCDCANIFSI